MTERRQVLPLDNFITRHENRLVPRDPREHARKVEEAIELFRGDVRRSTERVSSDRGE